MEIEQRREERPFIPGGQRLQDVPGFEQPETEIPLDRVAIAAQIAPVRMRQRDVQGPRPRLGQTDAPRLERRPLMRPAQYHVRGREQRIARQPVDADRWQPHLDQAEVEPLRQRPGLEPDPYELAAGLLQHRDQRGRLGQALRLQSNPPLLVDNAHARGLQRDVQTRIQLHRSDFPVPMFGDGIGAQTVP